MADERNQTKSFKLQRTILKMVDIQFCYACGLDHYNLIVSPLEIPLDGYNYQVVCPYRQLPVYIKFIAG